MFLLIGKFLQRRNSLELGISLFLFNIEDVLETFYRVLGEVELGLSIESFLSSCLSLLLLLFKNRVAVFFLSISQESP